MEMAGWQGGGGQEMCYEQPASKMNKTISTSGERRRHEREQLCSGDGFFFGEGVKG